MGLSAAARSAAQSFDRTAADYDRLGDLDENDSITNWLMSVLPGAGGRAWTSGAAPGAMRSCWPGDSRTSTRLTCRCR